MDVTLLKICLLVAMALLALLFGLLPIKLRRLSSFSAASSQPLSLVTCFAGGVFLGVCILDILPDAFERLESLQSDGQEFSVPWVGLLTGVGFFMVQLVELLTDTCSGHSHSHDEPQKSPRVFPRVQSGLSFEERPTTSVVDSAGDEEEPSHGLSQSISLVFALSVHSCLEGFAFGVQPSMVSAFSLFLGIMVHKAAVFFSAGLKLALSHKSVAWPIGMVTWLAAMAPVGAVAGMLVQDADMASTTKGALLLTLNCFSLGTFLHITFYELLVPEAAKKFSRLRQYLSTLFGFSLIAATLILCGE